MFAYMIISMHTDICMKILCIQTFSKDRNCSLLLGRLQRLSGHELQKETQPLLQPSPPLLHTTHSRCLVTRARDPPILFPNLMPVISNIHKLGPILGVQFQLHTVPVVPSLLSKDVAHSNIGLGSKQESGRWASHRVANHMHW